MKVQKIVKKIYQACVNHDKVKEKKLWLKREGNSMTIHTPSIIFYLIFFCYINVYLMFKV